MLLKHPQCFQVINQYNLRAGKGRSHLLLRDIEEDKKVKGLKNILSVQKQEIEDSHKNILNLKLRYQN